MTIGVYTSICEEDACWIDQYLKEMKRLGLRFIVHLDRCSQATKKLIAQSKYCRDYTEQLDPKVEFTEQHKQEAFDLLKVHGFDWAMAWDIDETWELNAPMKLDWVERSEADYLDCPWYNLWEDPKHIRIDHHHSSGHRVKFYRLSPEFTWKFDHPITNGLTGLGTDRPPILDELNFVCLHHGMMTEELRLQHKERWDRIYTAAVGGNPYGFWNDALDKSIKTITVRHGY